MKTSNTIIITVIAFSLLSVAAAETWEIEGMIVGIDAPEEVNVKEKFDLSVSITAPVQGVVTINPFLAMQVEPEYLTLKGKSGNIRKLALVTDGFEFAGTPVMYDYNDLYISGSDYGYNWRSIPSGYENGYRFARLNDNLPDDWKMMGYTFAIYEDNIIWTYRFSGLSVNDPGTYDFSMIINGFISGNIEAFEAPVGYGWMGDFSMNIPNMQGTYTQSPLVLTHTMTAKSSGLHATVDIDPNILSLKSQGNWITGYIELPDISLIDVSTVVLNDNIHAENKNMEIGDYDNDGQPDLKVKFDREAVKEIITSEGPLDLKITGNLFDGTPFEGWDTIIVK